jgi:V8-like Glu-specific endopeptidase
MKLRETLCLCLLMLCAYAPSAAAQPQVDTLEHPIINGSRSPRSVGLKTEEILAIGALVNYGNPEAAFCTGTAITNRVVLTAAHCVQSSNGVMRTPEDLAFVVGETPEIDGIIYDIAQVAIHPNYDYRSEVRQIEDVAVLLLASDLSDQAPSLLPIEFNRHPLVGLDAASILERRVEIAGYGKTDTNSSLNMKKGRFFTSVELNSITELTVVIDGQGVTGACDGDSGGPVLALNMRQAPVVLGVLRGGSENCVGQDHYARLDLPHVRSWIESYIMLTWPSYPEGAICGNLSYYGRCVANYVEYCDQNFSVVRQDCNADGVPKSCSFLNLDSGYACRPTTSCEGGVCKSRFDGFLPPAPLSIQNVGGCEFHTSQSHPVLGLLCLMLGLLNNRRKC